MTVTSPYLLPAWLRRRGAAPWRACVVGLMLAMLFSGWMGQMHKVAHAPNLETGRANALGAVHMHGAAQGSPQLAASADQATDGWLDWLFALHNAVECRLYDQLTGDSALMGAPQLILPLQLPQAQLLTLAGEFIARWVALFDARGPPRAAAFPN